MPCDGEMAIAAEVEIAAIRTKATITTILNITVPPVGAPQS